MSGKTLKDGEEHDVSRFKEALKTAKGNEERAAIFEKMGDAYKEMNKQTKAIVCYREAVITSAPGLKLVEKLAGLLDNTGQGKEAEAVIEKHLGTITDLFGVAYLRIRLGYIRWHMGLYDEGRKSAEMAVGMLEGMDRSKKDIEMAYADAYNVIGLSLWEQGKFPLALEKFNLANASYQKVDDLHGMAKSKNNIGLILFNTGRMDEALRSYQEALELEKKAGQKHLIGTLYSNIGLVWLVKGDHIEAEQNFKEGIKQSQAIEYQYGVYLAELNLADLLIDKGELIKARRWAERALAGFRAIHEEPRIAWVTTALARIALQEGDAVLATKMAAEAAIKASNRKARDTEAMAFRVQGLAFEARRDHDEAERLLRKSLETFKAMDIPFEIGRGLKELAIVLKAKGQVAEAAKAAADAREIFEGMGAKFELSRLDALAL